MNREALKAIRLEGENERLKKRITELTEALLGVVKTVEYYAKQPAHIPFTEIAFNDMSDALKNAKTALNHKTI